MPVEKQGKMGLFNVAALHGEAFFLIFEHPLDGVNGGFAALYTFQGKGLFGP